jgi:RNA polymerase sigma-70 factor (ECF subfamily)
VSETEASLLARAQAGDVGAFEELSGAYADRLFMLLLRLLGDPDEAGEVAQEVMFRAWRGIRRFQGRSSYFTWLYRIAVNEANRALERRARQPASVPIGPQELQLPTSPDDDPARQAETGELRLALASALAGLTPPLRTAIVLRDVEGFSTQEAAQIAGVSQAAFKSRLHQARLQVRAAIGDDALVAAAPLLLHRAGQRLGHGRRGGTPEREQLSHRAAHSGDDDNRQADPPAQPPVQAEDMVDRELAGPRDPEGGRGEADDEDVLVTVTEHEKPVFPVRGPACHDHHAGQCPRRDGGEEAGRHPRPGCGLDRGREHRLELGAAHPEPGEPAGGAVEPARPECVIVGMDEQRQADRQPDDEQRNVGPAHGAPWRRVRRCRGLITGGQVTGRLEDELDLAIGE